MNEFGPIKPLGNTPELAKPVARAASGADVAAGFADALDSAIREVDQVQKASEQAQAELAAGESVDLHEVLIKVEEAEIAFRTMMTVRNKLVDAYREVMRMGSGG